MSDLHKHIEWHSESKSPFREIFGDIHIKGEHFQVLIQRRHNGCGWGIYRCHGEIDMELVARKTYDLLITGTILSEENLANEAISEAIKMGFTINDNSVQECETCKGHGSVMATSYYPGVENDPYPMCPSCDGTGKEKLSDVS